MTANVDNDISDRLYGLTVNICAISVRIHPLQNCYLLFLPARRYASAGNSDRNVSVRLSVRLSRAGIVSKRRKRHGFFTIW